jgi:hypothetical protein
LTVNLGDLRAAAVPVIVAGIAFALWQTSDRLLFIGPIDRGTFAAFLVIPLWAIAPGFASAWRDFSLEDVDRLAAAAGLVVGVAIAIFMWREAVAVDCAPTHTPLELVLPALVFGAVIGTGFGLACRLAAGQSAGGHPWRGVTVAAVIQLAVLAFVPWLQFMMFFGLCQRP